MAVTALQSLWPFVKWPMATCSPLLSSQRDTAAETASAVQAAAPISLFVPFSFALNLSHRIVLLVL